MLARAAATAPAVSRITDKNVKSSKNLIDKKGTHGAFAFVCRKIRSAERSYEIPSPRTGATEEMAVVMEEEKEAQDMSHYLRCRA